MTNNEGTFHFVMFYKIKTNGIIDNFYLCQIIDLPLLEQNSGTDGFTVSFSIRKNGKIVG